jgi:hypothetical protein
MTAGRRVLACGLAAAALLLGGCVFLRLLQLKLQLDDFDRNFAVATSDGLVITCHRPVMRPDDVRWFGAKPETITRSGTAEHWHLRMVKELPPGTVEAARYDILLELTFVDGRLNRVKVPEEYFAAVPKVAILELIRSLGRGAVDQGSRSIEASVAHAGPARPTLSSVHQLLGAPSELSTVGPRTLRRYRFRPATTEPEPGVFDLTMTFDTASGDLRRMDSRTPVGTIGFKFPPAPSASR